MSHEMRFRIWYSTGDCLEVCEDAEGLGAIEIRYRDENDEIKARLNLWEDEQVDQLVRSLRMLEEFIARRKAGSHRQSEEQSK